MRTDLADYSLICMAAIPPLVSRSGITEHLLGGQALRGHYRQPCSQKEVSEVVCELCVGLGPSLFILPAESWAVQHLLVAVQDEWGHCMGVDKGSGVLECFV